VICENCDQDFADGAVKIFRGKKVCPSCFQSLTMSTIPQYNQRLEIIKTQHIQTTVCPDCNAELHIDTRTCPKCGAKVRTIDRAALKTGRILRSIINGLVMLLLKIAPLFLVGIGIMYFLISILAAINDVSFEVGYLLGGIFSIVVGLVLDRKAETIKSALRMTQRDA